MVEDKFERDEEVIKAELEGIKEKVEEEMIVWKGYEFITSSGKKVYSVSLTIEKAERLFEGLKAWTGSQRDFYFRYVNPLKLCDIVDARKEVKRLKELNKKKGDAKRLEKAKAKEEMLEKEIAYEKAMEEESEKQND